VVFFGSENIALNIALGCLVSEKGCVAVEREFSVFELVFRGKLAGLLSDSRV
jgi:hypothetical protein